MKKSIESIWKEGFLSNDELVAPKINDLYNQKSSHIIDKFKMMFNRNLKIVIIVGILFFIISFLVGVPIIGGFMLILLTWVVYVGIKIINELENIDKGNSSYLYLKSFHDWLKSAINTYAKIYRFIYPLFFLAFMAGFWFANLSKGLRDQIINDPDTVLVFGIPVYWVAPILLFAGLFSIFSYKIYLLDIKAVYGSLMNKLEELISDMESLIETEQE